MKRKLILLGILSVIFVLFLGAVSASTPEKRVTTVNSDQSGQSSDGTKVVWVDERRGAPNIYVRDLASPAPEIAIDAKNVLQRNPDISGDIVVWEDYRNGNGQIYYKNRDSVGNAKSVQPSANRQQNPRISGNKVIWMEVVGIKYVLRGYDLKLKESLTFPLGENHQMYPDIDGDNVVYTQITVGLNRKIMLYNLINHRSTLVVTDTHNARISADNIVYAKQGVYHEPNYFVVKAFNITSGTTTVVSNSRYDCMFPDIYGNIVAWDEVTQNAKQNIYMKNISNSTNPIITVCNKRYPQIKPTIGGIPKIGYFVAWTDYRNGENKPQIYYRNMETVPPKIISTIPQNSQWGINRFSSIIIKFNKFMNKSTNYNKIIVRNVATNQNIAITKYLKFDTLLIKTATKRPKTYYQVIIPAKALQSVAANNLAVTKTITYRTRA